MHTEFIKYWESLNFNEWNEMDVREEFIAPLLKYLGYGKGTVNNVIREKTLNLNDPYHRVGRKKVQIDYLPTIRLKSFWIIEAKPGNQREMDMGDLLQAHLYAIHPEIQARYIVLINGWEIRIYDTLHFKSWEDYLICCTKDNAAETFDSLFKMIGSREMLRFARQQILKQIEDNFEVELDTKEVNSFFSEINRKKYELESKVENNARDFQRAEWIKQDKAYEDNMKSLTIDQLLISMDIPTNAVPRPSFEYLDRILAAGEEERSKLVDKLSMTWRGRPHSVFRVHCLNILMGLLLNNIEIKPSIYQKGVKESINELAHSNINYYSQNDLSYALCHLDNTTLRVAHKSSLKIAMDKLKEKVTNLKNALPIEELLKETPNVAKEMIPLVGLNAEKLWRLFSHNSNAHLIWEGIWLLEKIEEIIDQLPESPYPAGDGDLLFFSSYGKGFDMLIMGTWDILNNNIKFLEEHHVSSDIIKFAKLDREEARNLIPKSKPCPTDWEPNLELLKKLK
jgi:hypothetical protein